MTREGQHLFESSTMDPSSSKALNPVHQPLPDEGDSHKVSTSETAMATDLLQGSHTITDQEQWRDPAASWHPGLDD